jgi:hypothetical protein
MTIPIAYILASFTTPIQIDTTAASMVWLVPLVASIAIVYKATKVYQIRLVAFLKESAALFASIMVFIIVAAIILYGLEWFVTERLPSLLHTSAF